MMGKSAAEIYLASKLVNDDDRIICGNEELRFFKLNNAQCLLECLKLMELSAVHKKWNVKDIGRFIYTPIVNDMIFMVASPKRACAFLTYAFLDDRVEKSLLDPNLKFKGNDWASGDNLRLMEFVAPLGHAKEIIKFFRRTILPRTSHERAKATRRRLNKPLKAVVWKKVND